jgi:hypothetical protein
VADATVSLPELFGTDDPATLADKFSLYKSALSDVPTGTFVPGQTAFQPTQAPGSEVEVALAALGSLEKSVGGVSAETIASLRATLSAQQADIVKDITLTSPVGTGLVAYDLEAPSL